VKLKIDPRDSYFRPGHNFKWFKRTPIYGKEAEEAGRNFKLEVYKETLEDIDPLFCEYPRHGNP